MMDEQLQLIPDKPINPKLRKVVLDEIPDKLPGQVPDKAFVQSIECFGVLQPVGLIESSTGYKVAFGRRRIKAARALGMISIPAYIYPAGWSSTEVLTLVENQQRNDNLAAELEAIEALRLKATTDEICLAVGLTKQELNKALKLIDGLVPELRQALAEGRITASTAQKAVRLTPEQQELIAALETIKAKDVDALLQVKTSKLVDELPDFLFEEVQPVSWQSKANKLIEELLETVPKETVLFHKVWELAESLMSKAA